MKEKAATDPWRGIRRGDRYYRVTKSGVSDLRYVVTDTWFDPIRGENDTRRGYMVALAFADLHWNPRTGKWPYAASTVAGKSFVRADLVEARAKEFAEQTMAALTGPKTGRDI